ncbi:MAG: exodeoxyribonuclease VII large subunit [Rhodobacteraceae bacterium]|jgi:exodeoxyribonuclease VII large subunit|nr:exodeoxyribonuclease VII large subunit [Paracoccaceae bacterium]
MSDLIDDDDDPGHDPSGGNAPEFTVSELSGAIKRVIEGEFGFVRVRGEIGRVSLPRSGHVYLDLKDDRSVISGVIWKGVADRLTTRPEEGMEVIATGRLTTFPGQSKYQIVIDDIRPAGQGALMAMLERRKAQLAAEGLFDAGRKKPIPFLPEVIGVVTSPSGAVIRDILHRLRDRFPRQVLIWPVAVQGEKCAPEVAAAIRGFNALPEGGPIPRPDVLIVARGGGSVEDLWGFNEEIVVRAAAASAIPLISAVGHETDTTLIDFAADRRAPTPTAAAEMAVPVRGDLLAWAAEQEARLARAAARATGDRRTRLRDVARALPRPEALLDIPRQRLDRWGERLPGALVARVQRARVRLAEAPLRPDAFRQYLSRETRDLSKCADKLAPALARSVGHQRRALDGLSARLTPHRIAAEVRRASEVLADRWARLRRAGQRRPDEARARLDAAARLLGSLGYEATLERGYAVVRAGDRVVTTRAEAARATALEIQFRDGRLCAAPAPGSGPSAPPAPAAVAPAGRPRPRRSDEPPGGQGSLF